jgi:hypothetical protein
MNAAVNLISLDRKLLYDGLDEGFYQFVFNPQIPGLPSIATDDFDENYFQKLIPLIGPQAFSQLLQEGDFMKNSNEYAFKGTDKLSLRFLLRGNTLLVFAMGEFQPNRYKIYLEGIWDIRQS